MLNAADYPTAEPGQKLNLFAPAAMVGFFEELAEASHDASPELLAEIAAHNNMEIVGPVPDTYL